MVYFWNFCSMATLYGQSPAKVPLLLTRPSTATAGLGNHSHGALSQPHCDLNILLSAGGHVEPPAELFVVYGWLVEIYGCFSSRPENCAEGIFRLTISAVHQTYG